MYEFTAILDRVPTDDEIEALWEAGLDDTAPVISDNRCTLDVAREAESLTAAIISVAREAKRAGFRVVGIDQDDLVSLKTIATRLGRTYESVRLWATGKRGPGGFPRPLSDHNWSLYSWSEVIDWLEKNNLAGVHATPEISELAAINSLISAYAVLSVRKAKELEPLAELVGKQ